MTGFGYWWVMGYKMVLGALKETKRTETLQCLRVLIKNILLQDSMENWNIPQSRTEFLNVIIIMINVTGFRITYETDFWACLRECFQG